MQFIIAWNEDHKCFVDEMGLPIPLTDLRQLQTLVNKALKTNPADLAESARELVSELHPRMVERMEENNQFTAERFA